MAKIWDKGYQLDRTIERFTVGRDYLLDRNLIVADCMASVAHARMLARVGLIEESHSRALVTELRAIARRGAAGEIEITPSDEDCHTVIEALLTEALGEVGKTIHTGRSRNDQVTAATRLYVRERLNRTLERLFGLVELLLKRAEDESGSVMGGRTHLQPAMLSSFGLWLAAFAEALLDDAQFLVTAAELNNRSPLGSAASYGVPLPLDREFVATELGFDAPQNNVLAVQFSRGKLDGQIAGAASDVMSTLSRMATDLILFALPEWGYVRLPLELCSGSSIMPQKRNPDALELLRAKAATAESYAHACRSVVRALPSGYNRDLQETNEPLLRSLALVEESLAVAYRLIERLEVDAQRMKQSLNQEIFATDYAYRLVREGAPFRDAYRRAADEYATVALPDATEALAARTATGSPGNLNTEAARVVMRALQERGDRLAAAHRAACEHTLGHDVELTPRLELW